MATISPYQEALIWIQSHPCTGSAVSLAKLLLSLWNDQCAFSFRECVGNLDDERSSIAIRMVEHFNRYGEDAELVEVGHLVCELYPRLWELGQAASNAKYELREQWRVEDNHMREDEDA
jgi:hypothetical protein